MDKDKASVHDMSETEYQHAKRGHGGGFSGSKSKRTKRRQELLAEQERHAMDKPKKLETQTDGDLSEVKKDPIWKTWLEKGYDDDEPRRPERDRDPGEEPRRPSRMGRYASEGAVKRGRPEDRRRKRDRIMNDMIDDYDKLTAEEREDKKLAREGKINLPKVQRKVDGKNRPSLYGAKLGRSHLRAGGTGRDAGQLMALGTISQENAELYKSWLELRKPIPDSKGGRGSFQQCINNNKDKRNPGGWCKQIERKISKVHEGESEEVEIGKLEKLRNLIDDFRYKKRRKKGSDHHLSQEEWEQAENEEQMTDQERNERSYHIRRRRKKKAKKQTKIDEPKHWWDHSKVGRNTGWEDDPMNEPSYFFAVMRERKEKEEKEKKRESKEKTDKCPGCDGEGKKWHTALMVPYTTDCPDCKGRGKLTPTQQQNKEAKEADDEQYEKLTEKADYFVEEIRSNIIYENKIFPLVGMIAGQVARGVGNAGKKVGKELLSDIGDMGEEEE